MMKVISFILLFAAVISAQVENSSSVNPYSTRPRFYVDLATYKAEESEKSKVDAFVKVPYSNIQFIKDGGGYKAGYTVTLTFMDEDKDNIIFETLWDEDIRTSEFDRTTSSDNFNISYRSVTMKPGKYFVRTVVEDLNSDKNSQMAADYFVKEFKEGETSVSSLVLVADRVVKDDIERIVPSVSNLFTTRDNSIELFYEIYSPGKSLYKVVYKLIDNEKEDVLYEETDTLRVEENSKRIYKTIDSAGFSLGNYTLKTELYDKETNKKLAEVGEKFTSKIYGFPHTITDLQLAIDQMMYIATDSDLDYIQDPDDFERQLDRYREFWKAKDPSPNTPENEVLSEYYRRVGYANEKFESYYPGWRTDMGMIYITLGAPDQVDRHPFEFDSKPYEVWDYYQLNRRFIFVDETGFGDYRLVNPAYGDWFRYRY